MFAALRAGAAAIALLALPQAWAGDEASDSPSPALRAAEQRGTDLYRADRAAWLTTDQLMAQGLVDARGVPVRVPGDPRGWVSSPSPAPGIWGVAYVSQVEGQLVSFADGTVDFTAQPLASLRENAPPRPLNAAESMQLRLRDDATGRSWMACSRARHNVAILPDGAEGWSVYLMPPQVEQGVFPLGGFHRFRYDANGDFIEHYSHTRSCLAHDSSRVPKGAVGQAIMVSHLTSALPNEMHVFMNLAYGMPVFIQTPDQRLWRVEGGRIHPVAKDASSP